MVVLPSTGASRYHNCCRDGGTSPENFGSTHVIGILEIREAIPLWDREKMDCSAIACFVSRQLACDWFSIRRR